MSSANSDLLRRMTCGAIGGLAGTVVIHGLMAAEQKLVSGTTPPIQQHPGEFMLRKLKGALPDSLGRYVPESQRAANLVGMGYGVAFGKLYCGLKPGCCHRLRDGAALGLVAWATGYLGWLPATGLMPPIWKHTPRQVVAPLVEHLVYGVTAITVCEFLRGQLARLEEVRAEPRVEPEAAPGVSVLERFEEAAAQ